ncbi:hypothetical protein BT63DRAFT_136019 [Microthyrium microscopicum]|uniref:Uncharacterized protein n=1 Tax=Microthyrium microscopicum TaxID=703497 RepID=A0A6A6UKG2_9PEZI|nr:hypothetical protein BT63DRAFT_136019 [Microthyrium microscopicum]
MTGRRSKIRLINLQDQIAPSPGNYSSFSVISPVFCIERKSENEDDITISAKFMLQVDIRGFMDGEKSRRYRFFDSVSLRYLYFQGEKVEFSPKHDGIQKMNATLDSTQQTSLTLGVKPGGGGVASGDIEYQVMNSRKLVVARPMTTWRCGVGIEPYQPLQAKESTGWMSRLVNAITTSDGEVDEKDTYPRHYSHHPRFDASIHWSWQSNLQLQQWTPDLYDTVSWPVVVSRTISYRDVLTASDRRLRDMFHFHFEVDTQVRELSHWSNIFKTSKPAESRFRDDTGHTKPSDQSRFRISLNGSVQDHYIPSRRTWNLREELLKEVNTTRRDGLGVPLHFGKVKIHPKSMSGKWNRNSKGSEGRGNRRRFSHSDGHRNIISNPNRSRPRGKYLPSPSDDDTGRLVVMPHGKKRSRSTELSTSNSPNRHRSCSRAYNIDMDDTIHNDPRRSQAMKSKHVHFGPVSPITDHVFLAALSREQNRHCHMFVERCGHRNHPEREGRKRRRTSMSDVHSTHSRNPRNSEHCPCWGEDFIHERATLHRKKSLERLKNEEISQSRNDDESDSSSDSDMVDVIMEIDEYRELDRLKFQPLNRLLDNILGFWSP